MDIPTYRKHLEEAKRKLLAELPRISEEIAVSTLSIVKDRSINEGIIVQGKPGTEKQYSTNPIPTSLFKGKKLNAGGDAYIVANKMGTWHGFRKAQGLSSEEVNLSYTNRMWTGIQVIQTNVTEYGKAESIVGAVDDETKKKLEGNIARYGMFLDPTADELSIAQDVARERINEIIRI